jgi:hypothetical protein
MKIILGGKFEIGLVRSIDAIIQPDRNASTHPYYAGVNRFVPKSYFERCASFLVLANTTLVPCIDWNYPYGSEHRQGLKNIDLGIERDETNIEEWDEDTRKFVKMLLSKTALSLSSQVHISSLSLAHYPAEIRKEMEGNIAELGPAVAEHYLCRLFLQLNVACQSGACLVLEEQDIQMLHEIGTFVKKAKIASPFELPDLSTQLIDPDRFCDGILNFSPPDVLAVGAVRRDPAIQKYAEKVSRLVSELPSQEREREMLAAMIDAHERSVAGAKAEKIFEIFSWAVKPLHYVPGVDATLTALEDAKDLGMKWLNRAVEDKEWYLIGARMQDIAIKDYLARKSNILANALAPAAPSRQD